MIIFLYISIVVVVATVFFFIKNQPEHPLHPLQTEVLQRWSKSIYDI